MFNFLKKTPIIIKKDFIPRQINDFQTQSVFFQQSFNTLRPSVREYITHYQEVEPLADGADRIGDKIAEMDLVLRNKKTKDFVDSSWVLDLMNNPNPNTTYADLMKSSSNYLTLTGNNYWILRRSPFLNKVLEIEAVSPELITVQMGSDSRPLAYNYFPQGRAILFSREDKNLKIRYFSEDRRAELIHIRDFNPNGFSMYIAGVSRLHAITYSIMQYKSASIHNLSLLENGARPSGMFKLDPEAMRDQSDEQKNKITADLESMFVGSQNAGRPLAMSVVEDFINFMTNNVDMDFLNLKKHNEEAIYKRLKIPLMLVGTDAATLNNYQVALKAFYHDAIIPQFKQLMSCLKMAFLNYDDTVDDFDFTFNPLLIDALRENRISELTSLQALSIMTDNELRNLIDLPDYPMGDEIWKSTTLAPISTTDSVSAFDMSQNNSDDSDDNDSDANNSDEDDDANNTSDTNS